MVGRHEVFVLLELVERAAVVHLLQAQALGALLRLPLLQLAVVASRPARRDLRVCRKRTRTSHGVSVAGHTHGRDSGRGHLDHVHHHVQVALTSGYVEFDLLRLFEDDTKAVRGEGGRLGSVRV